MAFSATELGAASLVTVFGVCVDVVDVLVELGDDAGGCCRLVGMSGSAATPAPIGAPSVSSRLERGRCGRRPGVVDGRSVAAVVRLCVDGAAGWGVLVSTEIGTDTAGTPVNKTPSVNDVVYIRSLSESEQRPWRLDQSPPHSRLLIYTARSSLTLRLRPSPTVNSSTAHGTVSQSLLCRQAGLTCSAEQPQHSLIHDPRRGPARPLQPHPQHKIL